MASQRTAPSDLRSDGRSHHDMGGLSAGPVDRSEHDYAMWEKRVDALMVVLSSPRHGLLKVDELRRHIEGLGADAYDAMSYYERWMAAISATLIERGVISIDALGRKMAEIEERHRSALEP
jgi:Nitrile hydratase beta subunit